jgi:hypothetical protein
MTIIFAFLQFKEVDRIDLRQLGNILQENNPLFEELK